MAAVINSFRDLRVWQASMDLVENIYRLTSTFPKQETYGLSSQIQRAAVSVPSNLAEGHTRESTKEYLHHLSMSQASLAELETQLEIAFRLKYIDQARLQSTLELVSAIGRQLFALRNALAKKING